MKTTRKELVLRTFGIGLLALSAVLVTVAFVDFFLAMGERESPSLFFLFFIGFPLLPVGAILAVLGFRKKMLRVAGMHAATIAKTAADAVREESSDGVRYCAACGKKCATEDRFCPSCGQELSDK